MSCKTVNEAFISKKGKMVGSIIVLLDLLL